jgi:hypothetical protein
MHFTIMIMMTTAIVNIDIDIDIDIDVINVMSVIIAIVTINLPVKKTCRFRSKVLSIILPYYIVYIAAREKSMLFIKNLQYLVKSRGAL